MARQKAKKKEKPLKIYGTLDQVIKVAVSSNRSKEEKLKT